MKKPSEIQQHLTVQLLSNRLVSQQLRLHLAFKSNMCVCVCVNEVASAHLFRSRYSIRSLSADI